jgi:hypothetical protein
MLPAPQRDLCLSCHESRVQNERKIIEGALSADAAPPLLGSVLASPFGHPINVEAFSRHERGVVTCTSCHSAHRSPNRGAGETGEVRKSSPRNPTEWEFELCEECHGSSSFGAQDALDTSYLVDPRNASYHPVKSPARDVSPSLFPDWAGREINCTDCHGNSDPNGARGPHGSSVRYILRAEYVTADGGAESPAAYALCYGCHDRARILDSELFPEHRLHVVDQKIACSSCHNPHGSTDGRALIRFGEFGGPSTVSPSGFVGTLSFVSDGPGSGACYLTCHGYDHGPAVYGGAMPVESFMEPRFATPPPPGVPQDPGPASEERTNSVPRRR